MTKTQHDLHGKRYIPCAAHIKKRKAKASKLFKEKMPNKLT